MSLEHKPLFDILALEGKKCQNAKYDWHVMSKSRFKPDPFYHGDRPANKNTFIITSVARPIKINIFCYHCAITFIGNLINDWKKAGATDEEISAWLPKLTETKIPTDEMKREDQ